MKMITEEILSNYHTIYYDIESIFYDPVFEEDLSDAGEASDNQKDDGGPSFGQKMKTTVETLMKTLLAIIDKYAEKFRNICMRILTSDKGFQKKIRLAIRDTKPLEAVKLISYEYRDTFLDNELNKISAIIPQYIREMSSENTSVDEEEETIEHLVLKKLSVPSNVKNMNLYFEYLKTNYRTEKKERLFKASETKIYMNEALSYDKTKNVITGKQQVMSQQASVIKGQLNKVLQDKSITKEVKRATTKRFKNVTHLYNIYTTFLDYYFQLKIEKFMTYRAVLKKLYRLN